MRSSIRLYNRLEEWSGAAVVASNLSQLDLTLGDVTSAVHEGKRSVLFADRSEDALLRIVGRTTHADALHQSGDVDRARSLFDEAQALRREERPEDPYLRSLQGFQYFDLLMAAAERAAWRAALGSHLGSLGPITESEQDRQSLPAEALPGFERQATKALVISERHQQLLMIALDHLTFGRMLLYREALEPAVGQMTDPRCVERLDAAVQHVRKAGSLHHLPRALLTRAWLRALQGRVAEAHADLDEAEQIAERGPMPLHLADVHLHRARLFFRDDLAAARDDLAKTRVLIFKHGYLRRKEELEDAERVIL